jgi:hypothetical protein
MTIQFQIRGMKDVDGMRRQLGADVEDLNRLMPVAAAHVALEHQRDVTPPYQAAVMLAVSGPDIHAAARDHTWLSAWRKVVTRLREQMEERRSGQTARQKDQPHMHSPAGHRTK